MILVFGGTTEGKKVAAFLESSAIPFVYSTKTKISFLETKTAQYRFGALNEKQLQDYILTNNITTIINAAHPFAQELHRVIAKVGAQLQLSVIRFARVLLEKTIHPLVRYVASYQEALQELEHFKSLLALTGVQSIDKLQPYWLKNSTYFRILNRPASLKVARKSNFPEKQLILGMPSGDLEKEITILRTHKIDVVLTKETGSSGFLEVKINAALQTNTPILIIKQPQTPPYFKVIHHLQELEFLQSKTNTI